jgi:hypothetical protein
MARRTSTTRTEKPAPAESDVKVTPESSKIESPVIDTTVKNTSPVNLEITTPDTEATTPSAAAPPEKVQTDVREKLAKKSTEDNVFVPTNPAALEKAAAQVAQEQGFELNRGTSVGARLMARAGKSV